MKQLQKYYGVSQDGKWGANSKKAAGGLTADQAWAKYQGGGSSGSGGSGGSSNYGNIRRTITGYMSQGNYAKAQSYLKSNWNSLTEAQQKELSAMFG